jgi:hypothetical protein
MCLQAECCDSTLQILILNKQREKVDKQNAGK